MTTRSADSSHRTAADPIEDAGEKQSKNRAGATRNSKGRERARKQFLSPVYGSTHPVARDDDFSSNFVD